MIKQRFAAWCAIAALACAVTACKSLPDASTMTGAPGQSTPTVTTQNGELKQKPAAALLKRRWARASTASIRPHLAGVGMYLPEYGVFIERLGKGDQGKARYEARAWIGVNSGSSSVFVQRRVRSVV